MEPFGTLPFAKSRHYVYTLSSYIPFMALYIHGNTGALAYFDPVRALIFSQNIKW